LTPAVEPEVDLAIVVVHWKKPDWCVRTVQSLLRSEGIKLQLIVVDNEASLGEALVGADVEGVCVLELEHNIGYTGGANHGIEYISHLPVPPRYVAVASHDVAVQADTLAQLVKALDDGPDIAIAAPTLRSPAVVGGVWRGWRAGTRRASVTSGTSEPVDFDWVSGTLMVVRCEALAAIGGFDERFGSYVEDVDLALRATDVGWKVVVVPLAVASQEGSSSSMVTKLVDWNTVLLVAKRHGLGRVALVWLRYCWWIPRGIVAALHPRRSRKRRVASLAHLRDHAWTIKKVLFDWGDVVDAARRPTYWTPVFSFKAQSEEDSN
jgi:GT2 family glycosyltransferase